MKLCTEKRGYVIFLNINLEYYGVFMDNFTNDMYNFIIENSMIESGDGIVVGVSGGADSVCLLLALCELKEKLEISRLVAVHVNHMIRGEEADEDEEFVKELCEQNKIEFISYSKDIPVYAAAKKLTIEEAGRLFRYECFEKAQREYSCNKIAVAHNKNDLSETVIFNMIRGTGLKGMSGIMPVRGNVIRPILGMTRGNIEEYLAKREQVFRVDSTNSELDYTRNKIRHIIIPAMEEINSGAIKHICQIADEAKRSYSFIHEQALDGYDADVEDDGFGKSVTLDVNQLYTFSPVLQEHVVHEAIGKVAGEKKNITRNHIMSVVSLIYQDTGRQVELPYNIKSRKSYDKIIISNKISQGLDFNITIDKEGSYIIPGWGSIDVSFEDKPSSIEVSKKIYTKMADYGKIKDGLCIRTPADGDYIVIDSKGSTKKLSRVFIDNKIDRQMRNNWPILANDKEVLWVLGLRYSESCKIQEDTKHIIHLDYKRKGE